MQFGLCLANVGTYADPRAAVRIARATEAAGWDGLFVWDHLGFVWGPPAADPWVVLSAIATVTERLRLGPTVTPLARRRPHVVAQTVASLDVLSGGRMVFGAGLGGSPREFSAFGEPDDAKVRAELLDEGLELLRRLWSGERVEHRGKHYTVDGVTLAPTPVQSRLPIWIGGNRSASLRRASHWDGWVADSADPTGMTLSPEDVRRCIATIMDTRTTGDPFDVAVLGESNRAEPAAYAEAGANWWLENVHDRRGTPEQMLALVEAGPPRAGG